MDEDSLETRSGAFRFGLRTAIVGGGKGCETVLRMVQEDTLGRFRMEILGVAEVQEDAPGVRYAREQGVPLITTDYRELFDIPDLDLVVELTGLVSVRDELERSRPRNVTLIDHVGARLFWQLHRAEEDIIHQRTELRYRVEAEQQRIQQVFDSIPDEVMVVDNEMVIQEANKAFLTHNSLDIGDLRGKHCYEVEQHIRGECQVAVGNCPFIQVTKDKQRASIVRKHFDDEGNPRFAAIVAGPLLDRDENVVGMIEVTRDITHRILLEEDLKAAEGQLKQFMQHAPVAVMVENRQGQFVNVNAAACDLLGTTRGQIIGKTALDLLPRSTAEEMRQGSRQIFKRGKEITFDARVELGGRWVQLSVIRFPILDAAGKVAAVCSLTTDVTAQREAEVALSRTREYLQHILDNSPVMVITSDLDGKIVSFNRGAEESLGYTAEEMIGSEASRLYADKGEREALLRRIHQEGAVRDYQTDLYGKDGTALPASLTLSQLRDASGRMIGTVGIAKDISRRKAMMDQILLSERLAAVGRLAAGVAHEINNPLAVIGEISGLLTDVVEDEPTHEELLAELNQWLPKLTDQVRRGRSVTYRMLSFARKSETDVHVVDVNAALVETLPFVTKEASLAQVTLHTDYGDGLPQVRVEEMQLQEIFINLINNAIQALGEGDGGNIWITTRYEGGKVRVAVRDDGPGIAEEVRDRLFDPFVTTKPPGKGTGLGLSICYGIVKRYDGEIQVDSAEGGGTQFTVVFPPHTKPEG
jgi:PAS domain S-box-containing protein